MHNLVMLEKYLDTNKFRPKAKKRQRNILHIIRYSLHIKSLSFLTLFLLEKTAETLYRSELNTYRY